MGVIAGGTLQTSLKGVVGGILKICSNNKYFHVCTMYQQHVPCYQLWCQENDLYGIQDSKFIQIQQIPISTISFSCDAKKNMMWATSFNSSKHDKPYKCKYSTLPLIWVISARMNKSLLTRLLRGPLMLNKWSFLCYANTKKKRKEIWAEI